GGRLLDHVRAAAQLRPPQDVASPHNDRELDPSGRHPGGLAGDPAHLLQVDTTLSPATETLARELEQDALEARLAGREHGGHESSSSGGAGVGIDDFRWPESNASRPLIRV